MNTLLDLLFRDFKGDNHSMTHAGLAAFPTAAHKPLPVLLVDDHALFRAGMHCILADGELEGSIGLQAGSVTEALSVPAILKHFESSTRMEAVMAAQKSGMVSVVGP